MMMMMMMMMVEWLVRKGKWRKILHKTFEANIMRERKVKVMNVVINC
jgi:transcriptional regulator CtsR